MAAGDGDGSDGQGQRGGEGEGEDGALLTARHCPRPHPPKDVKVVPDAVVLLVPDNKVTDIFSMPKLGMPKTDVPSPPTFNVPAHPPPKSAALLSSSVPEFKVPDAAPKFDMPKVKNPLFSMP